MDTLNSSWGIFNDVLPGDPWQPEPAARYNAVNELLRQERFTTPAAPLWSRGELTCINVLNTSDQPLLFNRAVQIDTDFAGSENTEIWLFLNDCFAVVLCYAFFPLVSVTRLCDAGRNAICVLVCHEAAVFILCLHITVDELHKEKLLKCNPLVKYLLCIVYREPCEVFANLCVRVNHLAALVVATDLLCWLL